MRWYGIVGTGGQGRETMAYARRMPLITQDSDACLVFVDLAINPDPVNGVPVHSLDEFARLEGEKFFNPAIGNPQTRLRTVEQMLRIGCRPFTVRSDLAHIAEDAVIGPGSLLAPNCLVEAGAIVAEYFHGNYFSIVGRNCIIGPCVTFGPGASCSEGTRVNLNVYIGAGASVGAGNKEVILTLSTGATIGMGSQVSRSVGVGRIVVGLEGRTPRALNLPSTS